MKSHGFNVIDSICRLRCPQTSTPPCLPASRTSILSSPSPVTSARFVYLSLADRMRRIDNPSFYFACVIVTVFRAPTFPNGRGRWKVAGGRLHRCLEEFNYIHSSHPLERIPLPAPLDHIPHPICDFRMNRPRWSLVLEHREDYFDIRPAGER